MQWFWVLYVVIIRFIICICRKFEKDENESALTEAAGIESGKDTGDNVLIGNDTPAANDVQKVEVVNTDTEV